MNKNLDRRAFLQKSACVAGYSLLASSLPASEVVASGHKERQPISEGKLVLKNVRLETGFVRDDFEVTGTKSDLFVVAIQDGRITEIKPNSNIEGAIDAQGYLMLPALRDMHIHLDKTFYGGPWQARSKRQRSIQDMINLEKEILPDMLKVSTERAEKMIELLQSKGTGFARSQVNVEPTSKLKSLENLQQAIENKKDGFGAELVAFPQHGLFSSRSEQLMTEAAKMDIDFIGGLDPYSIDGSIEKPIDFTVQLALDYNKGIDIHLHEGGESGLKTIQYLVEKVNENPQLKGKTFISHCFALRQLDKNTLAETAVQMANAGVGITSSIPFGGVMPIPTLLKHGVSVMAGTDSVMDHWSSFGTGSMMDKANMMAQLYGCTGDLEISRCLSIVTQTLPLDDKGSQQWPKIGNDADFILVEATCSAEAVARLSPIRALYYKGNCAYQNICNT